MFQNFSIFAKFAPGKNVLIIECRHNQFHFQTLLLGLMAMKDKRLHIRQSAFFR